MTNPYVFNLAKSLIANASLTPNDAGCQPLLAEELKTLGFSPEFHRFGKVDNLWARRGDTAPLLVFAGHTDVVPPGPLEAWNSPPFSPTVREGSLYGRGAADMKCALAAMVGATKSFLAEYSDFKGSIAFLITSDEEGEAINGTTKVIDLLKQRGETIDYCIVGEASSHQTLGDAIRVGRRGSLTGALTLIGKQGHTALPQFAENPIHKSLPFLADLLAINWGESQKPFPATSLQISNMHAGTGASNVIPGEFLIDFNCRFAPPLTVDCVKERLSVLLLKHSLPHKLEWKTPSHPYFSTPGKLTQTVIQTIKETLGIIPELSTAGGTSDGRFIATSGAEVIELGPRNASIHQANEHISLKELEALTALYKAILVNLF